MKHRLATVLLASGVFLASTLGNVAPAQAAEQITLSYKKSTSDPTRGSLTFHGSSWRAGSGTGKKFHDECYKNHGWLPNGTYKTVWYNNYNGSKIHGRVIKLNNKRCSASTVTRTELFIHSEQTKNNTPGNAEPTRWDGTETTTRKVVSSSTLTISRGSSPCEVTRRLQVRIS